MKKTKKTKKTKKMKKMKKMKKTKKNLKKRYYIIDIKFNNYFIKIIIDLLINPVIILITK